MPSPGTITATASKPSPTEVDREAEENRQKAKQLPCRYCQKRFRRLEHVQRHERTHTKEKPFMCGCGKTFGRRDLLVRHEKLVHLNEANNNRDGEHGGKHNHIGAQRAQIPIKAPQAPQRHMSPPHNNAAAIPNLIDPDLLGQQNGYQMGGMHRQESGSVQQQRLPCSLDLLSDAATHIASGAGGNGGNHQLPSLMQMDHENDAIKRARTESFTSRHQDEAMGRSLQAYHQQGQGVGQNSGENGLLGDYNILLDDFGISSHVFPPIDTEVGNLWGRPEQSTHSFGGYPDPTRENNHFANQQDGGFGRGGYGGRLSQQGEYSENSTTTGMGEGRTGPPWKISSQDHRYIQSKLEDFASVLPKTFELPSRHTLSRFLEGYVNGFNEHVPFLHIPTVQIVNLAPELILALAAIGAQYRFEGHRGNGLWYASRAVAVEQARRRASSSVMEILSPPATYKEESSGGFSPPSTTARHPSIAEMSRGGSEGNGIDQFSNTPEARLETIQALFLLVAVGTWSSRTLLRESLTVRSYLSLLVQESGLSNPSTSTPGLSWEAWIKAESEKRTKCLIYCFFNLHCIAYDIPPLIVSTKMEITLPQTAREWRASSAWEWAEIRRQQPPVEVKFLDALTTLFAKPGTILQKSLPATSSLGNYMLITAISQQIFFLRQTAAISVPGLPKNGLKESDIEDISNALKSWQASWERTPESSLDPTGPNGPVAFNSTALLRFAFIRLHSDLGPSKYLETRDPVKIARGFLEHPSLQRGSPPSATAQTSTPYSGPPGSAHGPGGAIPGAQGGRVGRAVLQAAHALSIPIKIGVQFVARTQTFSWSIQHSLCNLECAFLLSKWLETIAMTPLDLTAEERSLLDMVRTMLDETEYAVPWSDNATPNHATDPNEPPVDPSLQQNPPPQQQNQQQHGGTLTREETERREAKKIRQLGAAVVRLWAETFKGTQIFDIVRAMGMSLEIYGGLLRESC